MGYHREAEPADAPLINNIVIAGYAHSPFHFAFKGALARVRPDDLAAQLVRGLVERTGVKQEDIEDLIVGCVFPEGERGMNLARLIGLLADLPQSVGGVTVNRFCGSSMQSVHMAAGAIALEAGEVFICAGVERAGRCGISSTRCRSSSRPIARMRPSAAWSSIWRGRSGRCSSPPGRSRSPG